MPSKLLFVLSKYLDRLPRYKDSKFFVILEIYEWARDPLTYIFS